MTQDRIAQADLDWWVGLAPALDWTFARNPRRWRAVHPTSTPEPVSEFGDLRVGKRGAEVAGLGDQGLSACDLGNLGP